MLAVVRRCSAGEALPAAALALLAAATAGPRPLLVGLLWLAAVTPRLIEVDLAEHRLPDAVVLPDVPVVLASVALDRAGHAAAAPDRPPGLRRRELSKRHPENEKATASGVTLHLLNMPLRRMVYLDSAPA